uniref:G-protein coupled receptors family 1 profile domain-containing protein n=1 Tax=Sus scrofa TaxID=9823 RepID=A0A8W4FFX2_PIG
MRNHTVITTFILVGLTEDPELQVLIFIFLFLTYVLSVTGNLTIIILILTDSHLKKPIFLYSISSGDNIMTYNACASQIFFIGLFGATEFFLLAAVSYDHCVAICKPLHYMSIMNGRVCTILILCCWTSGLMIIITPLSVGLQLEFCDSNAIDHFGCDASPLFKISCSDTWFIEQMVIICAVVTFIITLIGVVLSYIYIIRTILRFPSASQRQKAFSTCSSHMIVVSITYGSCIFIYIKPSAKEEVDINKGASVLTTSIAPLLNPFIYTLRNKQVKQAFNDTIKKIAFTLHKSKK